MKHLNVLFVANQQPNGVHDANVNGIVDGRSIVSLLISIRYMIFYRECQVKHWSKHKPICEMLMEMSKSEQSTNSQ